MECFACKKTKSVLTEHRRSLRVAGNSNKLPTGRISGGAVIADRGVDQNNVFWEVGGRFRAETAVLAVLGSSL